MPRAAWYRPRLLLCPVPGMGWHWNAEQPPSAALSSLALLLPPLDSFLGPLWQGSLPQDRDRPEPGGWGTRQSCQVNTRSLRRCSIRLLVWPLLLFAQSQHTSRAPAEMGSPHGCTRCPEKLDAGLDLSRAPQVPVCSCGMGSCHGYVTSQHFLLREQLWLWQLVCPGCGRHPEHLSHAASSGQAGREPAPGPFLVLELGSCPQRGASEQHHAAVPRLGLDPNPLLPTLPLPASLLLRAGMDGSWARSGRSLLGENPSWHWSWNLEQKVSASVMPHTRASDPRGSRLWLPGEAPA